MEGRHFLVGRGVAQIEIGYPSNRKGSNRQLTLTGGGRPYHFQTTGAISGIEPSTSNDSRYLEENERPNPLA
jgi:hypothetical protein